jgi:hypothetical protein
MDRHSRDEKRGADIANPPRRGHVKRAWAAECFAACVVLAFASSGCLVISLQPAYDADSVVFDEALVGQWQNADDQLLLTVERGEWRSYKITYTDRSSSRILNGNITRIGEQQFVDVTEMRGADPGPYLLPVHGIFRMNVERDTLAVTPLDYDWFMAAIKEKRRDVPSVAIDDRKNVVMTSPTVELRRWLLHPPIDALGTAMTFKRK